MVSNKRSGGDVAGLSEFRMRLLTPGNLSDLRGGFFAIGNFDGVHRGHRAMVATLTERARQMQRRAVVVTFDPHPLALLRTGGAPPALTTLENRVELLHELGVDAVIALTTDWDLLRLTAEQFFSQIIVEQLAAAGLVEGPNFYFGKDRGGNITLLRQLCQSHGMALTVIEPITWDGQWVSSSAIRSLLTAGDLQAAVDLLGHPYRVSGVVVHGAERGRTLGFPTANLSQIATLLPGHGVYAGLIELEGRRLPVAVNIGPNPTFGEEQTKVEAHVLDFQGDLYGQVVGLDLLTRLRSLQKFGSLAELQRQLHHDLEATRTVTAAALR